MFEPSQPLVVVQCTEATPTTETNPQSCPARSTQQERRSCFPLEPFSLLKELLPTCYYSYLGWSWSGLIVDFVSRSQRWFGVMMMHFWIFLCDVWIELDGYDAGMWTLFGFLTKVFAKLCSTSSQFPAFGPTDRNGCQLFVVHPTRVDVEILGRRKTRPLGLHCNLNANIDQLMYKQVILCL